MRPVVQLNFRLNGAPVAVEAAGISLLEALREHLGVRSAKDGCSPQGQCGCCTVLVDGQPRVACVTPAVRVEGRDVTTLEGLDSADRWADAFATSGASQCGFCTPGIIVRLAALGSASEREVGQALLAHLCRCTGWRSIYEAAELVASGDVAVARVSDRDLTAAAHRAEIEGGTPQSVGSSVALGAGGFADDTAPAGALVAVPDGHGGWAVGETPADARRAAGKVQGRRTTVAVRYPLALPEGDWALTLRTTWVEPAYLEPDASWCEPRGEPASSLANGGAFGGKLTTDIGAVARRLADEHGQSVRVLLSREDVVRMGPKRPPVAIGMRHDGSAVMHAVRTAGMNAPPGVELVEFDVPGPPTSMTIRGAGWAEIAVMGAVLGVSRGEPVEVTAPSGGRASAVVHAGRVAVRVACGNPLDDVVLRSYCIGAAHMALGWVTSEAIAVDDAGMPHDLTIRSFGILRARDMPPVDVEIATIDGPPVNASDAVFAAVAAAVWLDQGTPPEWPTRVPVRMAS